jgi:uncharacterized protein (DUF58 family)
MAGALRNTVRRITAFAPSRRLVAIAAISSPVWLLSGSSTGQTIAIAAVVAIVIAAGFDIATMPSRDHIDVTRRFPANIGVGDHGAGRYEVHSRWSRAVIVTLFDRLPAAITAPAMDPLLTLDARGLLRIDRQFTGANRGDHALGPAALRVEGRLGLISRTLSYDMDDEIRGIPSVAAVRLFRLLSVQHRMRSVGVRPVRPRGDGRNFANLRDYAVGDDPRHIDWKATARRGKVISREYSLEQGQQILIVIDAGRLMTQFAGSLPRFEYALSSALVLADIAVHSGDAVGVVVFNDTVRRYVAPARGAAAVRAIRDALTAADATLVEPDYAAAFRTIAARQRNRALIVLFSDVLDVRSSHTLIAHLVRSAVRHLPLVVALRSEDLTAAALPGGRHSSDEVFQAAAAEELLIARETALAKMRAAGVSVVNVAPSAMTAAVVNRYLDIKARAAL